MKKIKKITITNRIVRVLWNFTWVLLYRPSPRFLHVWRRFLLRLFGAKIGKSVHPYPSAKIWAPWNLEMADYSCIGDYVDCYCVDKISIGEESTVSQYSFLCTASHDYLLKTMPLVAGPIIIGKNVWVAADVFVAPDICISDGSVITARSTVLNNIPEYVIAGGNPAKIIKVRKLNAENMRPDHG